MRTINEAELTGLVNHLSAQTTGEVDNPEYHQGMYDLASNILPVYATQALNAAQYRDGVTGSETVADQLSVAQVTTTLVITRNGAVSLATADSVLLTVDTTTYRLTSGLTAAAGSVTIAGIVAASEAGDVVEVAVMDGAVPLATWAGSVAIS